ncbi:Yip1 domain protein [Roseovarius sp. THAF9]|uniref:Yip1 family protein n=1 Tax=Roseovarius sp. THAF9 TaxID=2587847 RepID=UPI0012A7C79A|nr:Yip1 family protein [Roseovarius sp. THAF9]QFT93048.1 Yip1 domain protein [Roseovarius sp. THAF9]
MNTTVLKPLFMTTIRNPRGAAEQVIALNWPPQALWIALTLISVVTSAVVAALVQAAPLPQGDLGTLLEASPVYSSPLIFAVMQWARAVFSIFMLFWIGRALGGRGTVPDVLAVVTLLQAVSFLMVAGFTIVGMFIPFLSSLGLLVFIVWWMWAVSNMLDVAHGFDSPLKAFGVMVIAIFGVLVGLSIIMGVIGGLFAATTGAV